MELPSIVHTVKPINAVQVVELPTCMYQMPNLSLSFESTTPTVDSDLSALRDRQLAILKNLNVLKKRYQSCSWDLDETDTKIVKYPYDIVIHANPENYPYSLDSIKLALKGRCNLLWNVYYHSSLKSVDTSKIEFETCMNRSSYDMIVTVICKQIDEPKMFLNLAKNVAIKGEANIVRFFGRLLGVYDCDGVEEEKTTEIDYQLSLLEQVTDISKLTSLKNQITSGTIASAFYASLYKKLNRSK